MHRACVCSALINEVSVEGTDSPVPVKAGAGVADAVIGQHEWSVWLAFSESCSCFPGAPGGRASRSRSDGEATGVSLSEPTATELYHARAVWVEAVTKVLRSGWGRSLVEVAWGT